MRLATDLAFFAGAVLVPVGVGLLSPGAALIVAGLELVGGALLWRLGGPRR